MADDITETGPDKRFVLSREKFAKERIQGVREVVDEIKQQYPEALSFTMFGSMVKGTARPESDIDGYLFIGVDEAKQQKKQFDLIESGKKEDVVSITTLFDEQTQNEYQQMVRSALKDKLGLSDEQVKHVRVLPISNDMIDKRVDEMLEWCKEMEVFEGRREEEKRMNTDEWLNRPANPMPILVKPGNNVDSMFHLDVGGGIVRYREYLLQRLQQEGSRGERIWREVIEGAEAMEQDLHYDTKMKYPRTIEAALQTYGIKTDSKVSGPTKAI